MRIQFSHVVSLITGVIKYLKGLARHSSQLLGIEPNVLKIMKCTPIDRFSKLLFIISSIILALLSSFLLGFIFRHYKFTPYNQIIVIKDHILELITKGKWKPSGLYMFAPKNASRARIVIQQPDRIMPGFRGIMGFDTDTQRYAVWLIDDHGIQHHEWPVDYLRLKKEIKSKDGIINPHGMSILDDGSLLVNFERGGKLLARLDACGEEIWSRDGIYHHSIDIVDDGTLWTWRADDHVDGQFQSLVNLHIETGKTQSEVSLIHNVMRESSMNAAIIGVPDSYEFRHIEGRGPKPGEDIFHPNDIEALQANLAAQFPQFLPGDLLISLRNRHLVAVIDRLSGLIKWWSHGPWRFQHDPDFGADGRIYVYNNNRGLGRSDIIAIDPVSREVDRYFSNGKVAFYSRGQGKLTLIPNGTVQITVPEEGRVIEATWEGEIIFEFNNLVDEDLNAYVINSTWLPHDFFSIFPSCSDE